MTDPSKEDLAAVFMGDGAAPPMADAALPPEDDAAEMEAALDDAIDEAFSAEDPVLRREAFKRAIRLCKEETY